jgi:hypothetical protein
MANSNAQKRLSNSILVKKKQNAAKSLNNYLDQLKFHFELTDIDIAKVLEMALQERKNQIFVKKWWRIFQ